MEKIFDIAIIGGGINGCGIAADAALRGLSVLLLEKDDLASKTSSSSSKLIHGGLRYLENYHFKFVKKALEERQRILNLAPHLVKPLPFMLPYEKTMRPTWLLRLGLFIYDNLSQNNQLPPSKFLRRRFNSVYFSPLKEDYKKGFLFYDCFTDDARLTLTNALQAKEHGAIIYNYTKLVKASAHENRWLLTVQTKSGEEKDFITKIVINATGPWVESCNAILQLPNTIKVSLVKGSHFVVPKIYEGKHAYLLQHRDGRIVFIIPYQGQTMIGTTDVAFKGSLDAVNISPDEVEYLCNLVNGYLKCEVKREEIINTWSGVRALLPALGELKSLSRDYTFAYTNTPAPAITVYGGKITTYRQLALKVINSLQSIYPYLPASKTAVTPLPGATFGSMPYKDYLSYARAKYFWLLKELKERYLATYGCYTENLLNNCTSMKDLGYHFSNGLFQVEVDYLCREEWAQTCEDILWRRTKLGLNFESEKLQRLRSYLLQ